jgi:GGDEF domain-containing protein
MGDHAVGVVLPECDQEAAFTQAKRVLKVFGALSFSRGAQRLQVPIMAGISWWPYNGASSGQASFDSAAEAACQTEGAWVVALAGKGSARVPERA